MAERRRISGLVLVPLLAFMTAVTAGRLGGGFFVWCDCGCRKFFSKLFPMLVGGYPVDSALRPRLCSVRSWFRLGTSEDMHKYGALLVALGEKPTPKHRHREP